MGALALLLDVGIATALLGAAVFLRVRGRMSSATWRMCWLGWTLGMVWEMAFYLNGPLFRDDPPYELRVPFPAHPLLQPLLHSVWDAGLFMVGVAAVRRFCAQPWLARFRWQELGVMVAWGQAQEFCVELIASGTGAWTFFPRWYNPVLFEWGIGHITLLPQLIWLVAPVLFYLGALWIQRSTEPATA